MEPILRLKPDETETIKRVWFENERIYMLSSHDKVYSRPLEAFPILKEASNENRNAFTITHHGSALRWKVLDEDIHISSFFNTEEPDMQNEVAAIFKRFPQLNISEIARQMGINKSLLSKYIYGIKKPSHDRLSLIKDTLHALGRELMEV